MSDNKTAFEGLRVAARAVDDIAKRASATAFLVRMMFRAASIMVWLFFTEGGLGF